MKQFTVAITVVVTIGVASIAPTRSAPPTVTPSPGYDARLQEQRAASNVHEPVAPAPKPLSRHRARHIRDGAR